MIPIKHLMHINAPKEQVFKALSEAEGLSQWYTTLVSGDFAMDQVVTFEFVNFAAFKFKIVGYVPNTSIHFTDNSVIIRHSDTTNIDSASIEIIEIDHSYRISYWDGYSLAEEEAQKDLNKALKVFKRYAKKLAKNLLRFSQ